MKKTILVLAIIGLIFSCKKEKTKEIINPPKVKEKTLKVIKKIETPEYKLWVNKRSDLIKTEKFYNNQEIHNLFRIDNKESAYTIVRNITVDYGSDYRVRVLVKKGDIGDLFGLRIQGKYPSRVDAIFDLNNGTIKGKYNGGEFLKAKAKINSIGDGWYECSLSGEIFADNVWIVFGPTMQGKGIGGWEAKTKDKNNVYIIPTSLVFEEIRMK